MLANAAACVADETTKTPIRVGIIGLDAHAVPWTEIYAFMEGADESKRQGGAPIALESVLKKAKEAAARDVL